MNSLTQNDPRGEVMDLLYRLTGQENIITIPRAFVDYMGSMEGGAFLNQLLYWSGKMGPGFYKTRESWQEELGISGYQLDKYIKILKEKGALETELKAAGKLKQPTLHFTLNNTVFLDDLISFLKYGYSRNSNMDLQETKKPIPYTETTPRDYSLAGEDAPENSKIQQSEPSGVAGQTAPFQTPSKGGQETVEVLLNRAEDGWEAGRAATLPAERDAIALVASDIVDAFYGLNGSLAPRGKQRRYDLDRVLPLLPLKGSAYFVGLLRWAKDFKATDPARAPSDSWDGMAVWCDSVDKLLSNSCMGRYDATIAAQKARVTPSPQSDWRPPKGTRIRANDGATGEVWHQGPLLRVEWEDGGEPVLMDQRTWIGHKLEVVEGE